MNIDKEIKHGDIYGFGIEKIKYIRAIGVVTYSDLDKMTPLDLCRLPGFGYEIINKITGYIQILKEHDKKEAEAENEKPKAGDFKFFAGLAMQGILSAGIITKPDEVAADAIAYAKELMVKLEKE